MLVLFRTLLLVLIFTLLQSCGGGAGGNADSGSADSGSANAGGTTTTASTAAVPLTPASLTVSAGDALVVLNWSPVEGATSYRVRRATTAGGPYSLIGSPTGASFNDGGRTNGTTYYYVISAVNSAGESAASSEEAALPVAGLPSVPTTLSAAGADTQITLSWAASANATRYKVKRATAAGGPYSTVATVPYSPYTDTGRTNGATVYYVVSAVGTAGESADSVSISASAVAGVPAATVPAAPTGLFAIGSDTQIVLSWTASSTATSYVIKRATTANGPYTQIASVASAPYTDTGRTNGTTYYYVVSAVNSVGEGAASSVVSGTPVGVATPGVAIPAAPAGMNAVAGDAQIALSWNASSGASSYKLYRASTAGGPFTQLAVTTAVAYTNTALSNGSIYYYRVTALNTAGESAVSSTASATPVSTGGASSGGGSANTIPPAMLHDDTNKNYNGINMWWHANWAGARAFVDMMKQAEPRWGAPCQGNMGCGSLPNVATDTLGWPLADARIGIWNIEYMPDGDYALVFTGKAGRVYGPSGLVKDLRYDAATNTSRATVTISGYNAQNKTYVGGMEFRETQRTASSALNTGVTNVRLYRPGYKTDGSDVFTKEFLSDLGNFQLVRYMEWNRTNTNPSARWADRPLPEHATQTREMLYPYLMGADTKLTTGNLGVAYEHMIQAANASNTDMWISIPVLADDDYVTQLALLIRDGRTGADGVFYPPLKPNLRVYLEYGNEFFNFMTPLSNWLASRSSKAQADASHPIVFDGNTDFNVGMFRYAAWRAATISMIFRQTFGDAHMMTRIRPVLETQIGNYDTYLRYGLEFIDNYYGVARNGGAAHPVNYYLYGAGGAAYYGPTLDNHTDAAYVMAHFFDDTAFPQKSWLTHAKHDLAQIRKYGLKQIAYEGGLGLDNEKLSEDQRWQLMRDPRIKDIMLKSHQAWREIGGDILVYYCYGHNMQWGGYSAFDFDASYAPVATPKMKAMQALNAAPVTQPRVGSPIPGTLVIAEMDQDLMTGQRTGGTVYDAKPVNTNAKDLSFPVNAAKAGRYTLTVSGGVYLDPASAGALAKGITEVQVNGITQGTLQLNPANKSPFLSNSNTLVVQIPQGLSAIRLKNGNGFFIHAAIVADENASTVPPITTIARTRYDFDGDGRADIFWHGSADGQNSLYRMNGTQMLANLTVKAQTDTNWQVLGVADFDGDKRADVLWQNTATGSRVLWRMDGPTVLEEKSITSLPATGQWEGAGKPYGIQDTRVIWRDTTTGVITFAALNGLGSIPIGYKLTGTDWQLVGVGDISGDAMDDLFWRNRTTGELRILKSGAWWVSSNAQSLGTLPLTSAIEAIGDFDGDGVADILWRDTTTGALTLWRMTGPQLPDAAHRLALGTLSVADWKLAANADFDGDGKTDLVWRNLKTGETVLWLMNGATISAQKSLGFVTTAGWQIEMH